MSSAMEFAILAVIIVTSPLWTYMLVRLWSWAWFKSQMQFREYISKQDTKKGKGGD